LVVNPDTCCQIICFESLQHLVGSTARVSLRQLLMKSETVRYCKPTRLLGSISSTYLQAAFTPVAPQSVGTQSSRQYLFMLLGSMRVKAVRIMLMKLNKKVVYIKLNAFKL